MRCFLMGSTMEPVESVPQEDFAEQGEYVVISDRSSWLADGESLGLKLDAETLNGGGHFSKIEVQNDLLVGQISVPRMLDLLGKRQEVCFLMNERLIFFVDDGNYVARIVDKIRVKKLPQAQSKEQFLYNFISQILKNDIVILESYEKRMIEMEISIMDRKIKDFHKIMMPIRRELLVMKNYYEQIGEMGKELEENENSLFVRKRLKYFRSIMDRADRLEGKCGQLLDYSQQLRDVYQSQADARQNKTIEFLTVVSTIFLPLTLLTSWYGMNFHNMPELESGYPGVIVAAILIAIGTILVFKRKNIL